MSLHLSKCHIVENQISRLKVYVRKFVKLLVTVWTKYLLDLASSIEAPFTYSNRYTM